MMHNITKNIKVFKILLCRTSILQGVCLDIIFYIDYKHVQFHPVLYSFKFDFVSQ